LSLLRGKFCSPNKAYKLMQKYKTIFLLVSWRDINKSSKKNTIIIIDEGWQDCVTKKSAPPPSSKACDVYRVSIGYSLLIKLLDGLLDRIMFNYYTILFNVKLLLIIFIFIDLNYNFCSYSVHYCPLVYLFIFSHK